MCTPDPKIIGNGLGTLPNQVSLSSSTPSLSSTPLPQLATPTSSNSTRSSASPKVSSKRASPKEFADQDFAGQIPQAVLDAQNLSLGFSNDLVPMYHNPELLSWSQQYADLAKMPASSQLVSFPSILTANPSPQALTQFWQNTTLNSTTSSSVGAAGMASAVTAAGLQNNLNELLNFSYLGVPNVDANTSVQPIGAFDEALSAQFPMEVGMDDTWKLFVQDQGFQDPGIFEYS